MRFDTMVNSAPRSIELDGVSIHRSGQLLVDNCSISIQPGETLAIMGQSGVGKSTLLHAIAGLFSPSAGTIDRHGAPVAMIFQEPRLLPWRTVQQNVEFVLSGAAGERATDWLERVGLADVRHEYPAALSGGMRQRVSIARAFASSTHIMLVDEPFAHLDLNTADVLREVLGQHLNAGQYCTAWVTHSPQEAVAVASRTMVLAGPPTGAWRLVDHGVNRRVGCRVGRSVAEGRAGQRTADAAIAELTSLIHTFSSPVSTHSGDTR